MSRSSFKWSLNGDHVILASIILATQDFIRRSLVSSSSVNMSCPSHWASIELLLVLGVIKFQLLLLATALSLKVQQNHVLRKNSRQVFKRSFNNCEKFRPTIPTKREISWSKLQKLCSVDHKFAIYQSWYVWHNGSEAFLNSHYNNSLVNWQQHPIDWQG